MTFRPIPFALAALIAIAVFKSAEKTPQRAQAPQLSATISDPLPRHLSPSKALAIIDRCKDARNEIGFAPAFCERLFANGAKSAIDPEEMMGYLRHFKKASEEPPKRIKELQPR